MKTNFKNYDTCIFIIPNDMKIDEYIYEITEYFDNIYVIDRYVSPSVTLIALIGLSTISHIGDSSLSLSFTENELKKHLARYDGFLIRTDKQERIDLNRPFNTTIYKSIVKEYINELEEQGEI